MGAPLFTDNATDLDVIRSRLGITPRAGSPVVAFIGDSLTDMGADITGGSRSKYFLGYSGWVPVLSFQAVTTREELNFGISGETTTQILARTDAAIVTMKTYGVTDCVVLAGTNDISSDPAWVATATANLTSIYNKLTAAGIDIMAICPPLRGAGSTPTNGGLSRVCEWIRSESWRRKNMIVVDPRLVTGDPQTASTDQVMRTGLNSDLPNVHWSVKGTYLVGKLIAEAFLRKYPGLGRTPFFDPRDDWHTTDNVGGNLLTNGELAGTTGPVSGGSTGNLATNLNCSSTLAAGITCAFSKTTYAPDSRNQQRILIGGTGATTTINVTSDNFKSKLSTGDFVIVRGVIDVAAGLDNVGISALLEFNGGAAGYRSAIDMGGAANDVTREWPDLAWRGMFECGPLEVTAGQTLALLTIRAITIGTGSPVADFAISSLEARKVI